MSVNVDEGMQGMYPSLRNPSKAGMKLNNIYMHFDQIYDIFYINKGLSWSILLFIISPIFFRIAIQIWRLLKAHIDILRKFFWKKPYLSKCCATTGDFNY